MAAWRDYLHEGEERVAVGDAYPGAEFHSEVWVVRMRPLIRDFDEFRLVTSDLANGGVVHLLQGGTLAHSPSCGAAEHARLDASLPASSRFTVVLSFPKQAFGAAGPVHPKARIGPYHLGQAGLVPSIHEVRYRGHPHLSGDGEGDAWACPLPPHNTTWTWRPGAVLDYLDQVAIWLFKTEVWAASRFRPSRGGVWLGDAAGHAPTDVLIYPSDGTCRCGSGDRYGDCHRPLDLQSLFKRAA